VKKEDDPSYQRSIILVSLVLILNIIILGIKSYLYFLTISIAVLAYIFDTVVDIMNDCLSIIGLKRSRIPPDKDHPYGHSKYNAFVATIIATFVIASTFEIIREIFIRITTHTLSIHIDSLIISLLCFLAIVYTVIAYIQYTFSKQYKNIIIELSALRYITDPIFTIVVLIGILLTSIGLWWVDILVSIVIILVILKKALEALEKSSKILLDVAVISPEKLRKDILKAFKGKIIDCIDIYSRTDGENIFLELTLVMNKDLSLKEADKIADEVEAFIRKRYRQYRFARILIHQEALE